MTRITYLTVTTRTSDQKISDRMPMHLSAGHRQIVEKLQGRLEGIKRTRADIAVDDAEHAEQDA